MIGWRTRRRPRVCDVWLAPAPDPRRARGRRLVMVELCPVWVGWLVVQRYGPVRRWQWRATWSQAAQVYASAVAVADGYSRFLGGHEHRSQVVAGPQPGGGGQMDEYELEHEQGPAGVPGCDVGAGGSGPGLVVDSGHGVGCASSVESLAVVWADDWLTPTP